MFNKTFLDLNKFSIHLHLLIGVGFRKNKRSRNRDLSEGIVQ
jgi:hypothetical protein